MHIIKVDHKPPKFINQGTRKRKTKPKLEGGKKTKAMNFFFFEGVHYKNDKPLARLKGKREIKIRNGREN